MQSRCPALIGMGVVALLATSSLALYYRHQVIELQLQRKQDAAKSPPGGIASAPAAQERNVRREPRTVHSGDNANIVRSHRRDLDGPSAQSDGSLVQPPAGAVPETAVPRAPDAEQPGRRGTNWLEGLRTSDPARYEEMQLRREALLQQAQDAWTQTSEHLMHRDTSKMSDSEVQEYGTMLKLLDQTKVLSEILQGGLPPEERQPVVSALRSNVVALAPLLENERNREYYDLAVAMGHNTQDASAFVGYVNQIASNTSLRAMLPPGAMRGGGMGGFGGPGGPPFGGNRTAPPTPER